MKGKCSIFVIIAIIVRYISMIIILITHNFFPVFESISSTKIIKNSIEIPFVIPGASTERQIDLRVKHIFEREFFSVVIRPIIK